MFYLPHPSLQNVMCMRMCIHIMCTLNEFTAVYHIFILAPIVFPYFLNNFIILILLKIIIQLRKYSFVRNAYLNFATSF